MRKEDLTVKNATLVSDIVCPYDVPDEGSKIMYMYHKSNDKSIHTAFYSSEEDARYAWENGAFI